MINTGDKIRLNARLKQILKERPLSVERLAKDAELSVDALRSSIHRNKYSAPTLLRLMKVLPADLGDDLETLREIYDFDLVKARAAAGTPRLTFSSKTRLGETLITIKSRADKIAKQQQFAEEVRHLLGDLSSEDHYIYISLDELPYEFMPEGFELGVKLVSDAIERGAYFTYLVPSKTIVEEMENLGLFKLTTSNEFKRFFDKTKNAIMATLQVTNKEEASKMVNKQMKFKQVSIQYCPFFTPGHKYVCFIFNSEEKIKSIAAFTQIPTHSEAELAAHLPLNQNCANQLKSFIDKIL